MNNMLQTVCNCIILVAGVLGAITTICHFLGKPIVFFKKKREKEIEAVIQRVLPPYLEKSNEKILNQLGEIIDLNKQQSQTLDEQKIAIQNLIESERDILRYHIMDIYQTYKKTKAFPIYIKEKLEETYKNYKKLDGNHYIDKYFRRMKNWEVIDTVEEEEI